MTWKALSLVVVAAWPLPAQDFQGWARRLEARGVSVSAGIWDAETGKAIERYHEEVALVPASTTKVVTTYALLKTLKPDFTIGTEI